MGNRETEYFIYGLDSCPFCREAQDLLDTLGYSYSYVGLDQRQKFLKEVKQFYNHRTVPIVLEFDGATGRVRFIGGYDDLKERVSD